MNTNFLYLLGIFCVLAWMPCTAQNAYQIGILPSVNLNNKFKKDWSLNSRIESRQVFVSGDFKSTEVDKQYEYVLTDFTLISAKKIGLNSRIGVGYTLRYRDGSFFHRAIQQFTTVQKLSGFRLAHRFSSDQTFSATQIPEFRFRYRIGFEIPLNGESVDAKEFYLKINNEFLNSIEGREYDLEIRIVPLLGYDITDNNRVEIGLDYRVNSFLERNNSTQRFWMSFNWFYVLEGNRKTRK